jgi:hypothetical protein
MFKYAVLALGLFCGAAQAEASEFIGNWNNSDPKPSGLTHVVISPNGGDRVDVRAYGDCHPIECDWGLVQGDIYSNNPKSGAVNIISATFHFGFAHRQIIFRKDTGGRLKFEMLIKLDDNSTQHDYSVIGTLQQTGWAGPISQIWQRQPGLATGWGGGARDGSAPKPEENCTAVDTRGARAVERNGVWKVVAGGRTLVDAGRDNRTAQIAESVFRHYRVDRRCTVGGPWQDYWKIGNEFPREKLGGLGCIPFNPTTAHLTRTGGAWTIVDGVTTIASFGASKPKAEATLGLIRHYRLDAECFVRYPDPLMVLWVTNADAQH